MLQLLLESPFMVGCIGGALTIALLVGWIQTGQQRALWCAIGFLVLTLIGIATSVCVVTDREVITAMVYATADDLEENRFEKIPPRIDPTATAEVKNAVAILPNCKFRMANVTNLHEINIERKHEPYRATVKMNVIVEGSLNGFETKVPRFVELTLFKSGNRWLIQDFRHDELIKGFQVN